MVFVTNMWHEHCLSGKPHPYSNEVNIAPTISNFFFENEMTFKATCDNLSLY